MTLDRTEINRALAKAIAYKQCGKQFEAELWASRLVAMLECADILNPVSRAELTAADRGHTITLATSGTFHTKVNERHISGPSLDAIKKKVNDVDDIQPAPFTALELNICLSYGKLPEVGIRTVSVTSVDRGGHGRYHRAGFVGEAKPKKNRYQTKGSETFAVLYPDTPECRSAYIDYMNAQVETARIEEERKKIERALYIKIPRYEINTFLENGNRLVAEYPEQ